MTLKIGKDNSLFTLLEGQADVARRAAQVFRQTVVDFSQLGTYASRASVLETEGDDLTHKLQNKVASSFITPIDKEDLRELSQTLDDITDLIEAVIARIQIYRLTVPRKDLVPMADVMVNITEVVVSAVTQLKSGFSSKALDEDLTTIHTLENVSDELFRAALGGLFSEEGLDALTVIKWKEIYDRVELTMDSCEDIAKIIEMISVKYA